MGTTTKSLYDTDYAEWTAQTAERIRRDRFDGKVYTQPLVVKPDPRQKRD